ncbi:MAG: bifunctional nuclease family protein [Bacteroidota bacterium]
MLLLGALIFSSSLKSQNNLEMNLETQLIEYEVAALTVKEKKFWDSFIKKEDEYILELKEKRQTSNILKMGIGKFEAMEMAVAIENMNSERPLKSDLLRNIILKLGYEVEKTVIYKIEDRIFFALLFIKNKEGDKQSIDSRPADAITQAIKFKAPIYITEDIARENNR